MLLTSSEEFIEVVIRSYAPDEKHLLTFVERPIKAVVDRNIKDKVKIAGSSIIVVHSEFFQVCPTMAIFQAQIISKREPKKMNGPPFQKELPVSPKIWGSRPIVISQPNSSSSAHSITFEATGTSKLCPIPILCADF